MLYPRVITAQPDLEALGKESLTPNKKPSRLAITRANAAPAANNSQNPLDWLKLEPLSKTGLAIYMEKEKARKHIIQRKAVIAENRIHEELCHIQQSKGDIDLFDSPEEMLNSIQASRPEAPKAAKLHDEIAKTLQRLIDLRAKKARDANKEAECKRIDKEFAERETLRGKTLVKTKSNESDTPISSGSSTPELTITASNESNPTSLDTRQSKVHVHAYDPASAWTSDELKGSADKLESQGANSKKRLWSRRLKTIAASVQDPIAYHNKGIDIVELSEPELLNRIARKIDKLIHIAEGGHHQGALIDLDEAAHGTTNAATSGAIDVILMGFGWLAAKAGWEGMKAFGSKMKALRNKRRQANEGTNDAAILLHANATDHSPIDEAKSKNDKTQASEHAEQTQTVSVNDESKKIALKGADQASFEKSATFEPTQENVALHGLMMADQTYSERLDFALQQAKRVLGVDFGSFAAGVGMMGKGMAGLAKSLSAASALTFVAAIPSLLFAVSSCAMAYRECEDLDKDQKDAHLNILSIKRDLEEIKKDGGDPAKIDASLENHLKSFDKHGIIMKLYRNLSGVLGSSLAAMIILTALQEAAEHGAHVSTHGVSIASKALVPFLLTGCMQFILWHHEFGEMQEAQVDDHSLIDCDSIRLQSGLQGGNPNDRTHRAMQRLGETNVAVEAIKEHSEKIIELSVDQFEKTKFKNSLKEKFSGSYVKARARGIWAYTKEIAAKTNNVANATEETQKTEQEQPIVDKGLAEKLRVSLIERHQHAATASRRTYLQHAPNLVEKALRAEIVEADDEQNAPQKTTSQKIKAEMLEIVSAVEVKKDWDVRHNPYHHDGFDRMMNRDYDAADAQRAQLRITQRIDEKTARPLQELTQSRHLREQMKVAPDVTPLIADRFMAVMKDGLYTYKNDLPSLKDTSKTLGEFLHHDMPELTEQFEKLHHEAHRSHTKIIRNAHRGLQIQSEVDSSRTGNRSIPDGPKQYRWTKFLHRKTLAKSEINTEITDATKTVASATNTKIDPRYPLAASKEDWKLLRQSDTRLTLEEGLERHRLAGVLPKSPYNVAIDLGANSDNAADNVRTTLHLQATQFKTASDINKIEKETKSKWKLIIPDNVKTSLSAYHDDGEIEEKLNKMHGLKSFAGEAIYGASPLIPENIRKQTLLKSLSFFESASAA